FLRTTAVGFGDGSADHAGEAPGEVIGPYTLLGRLGEGGMGIVFLAEQSQPVRRQVALKIIRPGMSSQQDVARFEAERQALALMDHPNIAKGLDGGTIPADRSYFVMELVRGGPITRYCDERRLTLRERLGLFVQVCRGAQHAHQKGVIHRDLKPSNVLVAPYDGKPVPKIIDFGLAKAAESTLVTQVGLVVGTPEYMSPEQAGAGQGDIDTRSDVYSLGILLYELLTGTTPRGRGGRAGPGARRRGGGAPPAGGGRAPPRGAPGAPRRRGGGAARGGGGGGGGGGGAGVEGGGEGPPPPLPDGRRPGPRRRALPA